MAYVAKVFTKGGRQVVRLPDEYRFDTKEVFARQDPQTGDVILSRKPADWNGFFAFLATTKVPESFMASEDRRQGKQDRDPFDGWEE